VHIHSDKAMADLTIEPAGDSGRQITVTVLDGQFGPLLAKKVTLVLAKPEAGIEPLRLPATHVESTIWRIDRVHLPMLGGWRVRVEILVNDFEKVPLEDRMHLFRPCLHKWRLLGNRYPPRSRFEERCCPLASY